MMTRTQPSLLHPPQQFGHDPRADLVLLTAATRNAAEALGASGEIGLLAHGALADLVVLDGDPLEDVANVRSVVAVFQGGLRVETR